MPIQFQKHDSMIETLKRELLELDKEVQRLSALQARRARLRDIIGALEMVDQASFDVSMPGVEAFSDVVMRTFQNISGHHPRGPSEAALALLDEVGHPMHVKEIVSAMQVRGWFKDRDYESLRATISATLDAKARAQDTVVKPEPATYALRGWYQLKPEIVNDDQDAHSG